MPDQGKSCESVEPAHSVCQANNWGRGLDTWHVQVWHIHDPFWRRKVAQGRGIWQNSGQLGDFSIQWQKPQSIRRTK
jgi:hypothetical protein